MPKSFFWETIFEIWKHQCLFIMFSLLRFIWQTFDVIIDVSVFDVVKGLYFTPVLSQVWKNKEKKTWGKISSNRRAVRQQWRGWRRKMRSFVSKPSVDCSVALCVLVRQASKAGSTQWDQNISWNRRSMRNYSGDFRKVLATMWFGIKQRYTEDILVGLRTSLS